MKRSILSAAIIALALPGASARDLSKAKIEFFESKVRPILAQECYRCHSVKQNKVKGGLELDTREGLMKGGDTGPAVVPGRPEQSLLIRSVEYYDDDLQMPPNHKKLDDQEVWAFKQWVLMGAPYPSPMQVSGVAGVGGSGGSLEGEWGYAKKVVNHWAFKPVHKPVMPAVSQRDWVRDELDGYILARLEQADLKPQEPADKRTLIRRATFDLIGLPSTPEEVEAFVADDSPQAFEKVVDRLLDSKHFGERWGRHWLDVARYADTKGDARRTSVYIYPYSWVYRDWVVRALNEDKPYDQFIKEQIAGDYMLMRGQAQQDAIAALGFLTLGNRFGGATEEIINDRIDTVTKAFQGLTVSCARCHDHKFDPVPQEDYYSLRGVFASCEEPDEFRKYPLMGRPDTATKEFKAYAAEYEKRQAALEKFYADEVNDWLAKCRKKAQVFMFAYAESNGARDRDRFTEILEQNKLNFNDRRWMGQFWTRVLNEGNNRRSPLYTIFSPFHRFRDAAGKHGFPAAARKIVLDLQKSKSVNARVKRAFRGVPSSMSQVVSVYASLFNAAEEAHETARKMGSRRLMDPSYSALRGIGYMVDRSTDAAKNPFERLRDGRVLSRRLEGREVQLKSRIAELEASHPGAPPRAMIVRDKKSITDSPIFIRGNAREKGEVVPRQYIRIIKGDQRKPYPPNQSGRLQLAFDIANRDNPLTARVMVNRVWQHLFGVGFVPTPDDLGVMSDPPTHPFLIDHLASSFMDNGWSIKRLIRKIVLSNTYRQSSNDNPRYAQIDPSNKLLWRQNLRRLEFEVLRDSLLAIGGTLDRTVGGKPFNLTDERSRRRTIYAKIDRGNLSVVLNDFDFADPDMTSGRRYDTTIPQQALFMMNSPLVVELANKLTSREDFKALEKQDERIRFLYKLIYQRPPDDQDMELGNKFIAAAKSFDLPPENADQKKDQRAEPDAWQKFAHALLQTNEATFVN